VKRKRPALGLHARTGAVDDDGVSRLASSLPFVVLSLTACFPAPKGDGDIVIGTSGIDAFGSDDAPYTTAATDVGDDVTTEATVDPSTRGDETTDAPGDSSGGEVTTGGDVGDDSGDESSTDDGTPGELPPGYPVDQAFGDDVREVDLIGTWVMPWVPAAVPHVVLAIADDGSFTWTERAADCSVTGSADGNLWVEGTQLAMSVATWDKTSPWDTIDATGTEFEAPFRMRIGYTPMGGFLGMSAPEGMVDMAPWRGRGYSRIDASAGANGNWAAESELWATPPGDDTPVLVVRERFDAHVLDTSTATLVAARTWWYPEGPSADEPEQDGGPWSDQTPGNIAGAATIVGVPHAYDAAGLISFSADRTFKLGVAAPCG
jgi:hypothetical protein